MKKIIILGLAGLLAYGCNQQPVSKPDESVVKNNVEFAIIGLPESGATTYFYDANQDGTIDGLFYVNSGGHERRLMAYDTTQMDFYEEYNTKSALKMTPAIDSVMNNFIEAAKEFKWKYEMEKYNQQKRPK